MLKKLFKYIAIASVINLILISPMSYADEQADITKMKTALDKIKDKPCIDTSEGSPDNGYIITFIEEPLDISNSDDQTGDFIYRKCYRNTLQYTQNYKTPQAKVDILSFVSREQCSPEAMALLDDPALVEKYNIRYACKEIQAILSKGGTSLLYGYIGMIYKWAASIVGVIAVTVIILSGIQMSASGGDPDALSKAKTRILQSIGGIIVLFLSGLILNTINPNFFTAG